MALVASRRGAYVALLLILLIGLYFRCVGLYRGLSSDPAYTFHPDTAKQMVSLGIEIFLAGLIGTRIFFVLHNWGDLYAGEAWWKPCRNRWNVFGNTTKYSNCWSF